MGDNSIQSKPDVEVQSSVAAPESGKKGEMPNGKAVETLADGSKKETAGSSTLYTAAWWGGVALAVSSFVLGAGAAYLWLSNTNLAMLGFEITANVAMYATIGGLGTAFVLGAVLGVSSYLCKAKDATDANKEASGFSCFGMFGGKADDAKKAEVAAAAK